MPVNIKFIQMKKALLFLALSGLFSLSRAVEPMFIKGDKYLNFGAGINSYVDSRLYLYPVIDATFDYCLLDGIGKGALGVGGYAGLGFESGKYHHYFAGVRGTFHYPIVEDFDTYLGASLGFCFDIDPYGHYGPYFIKGLFIGANYPLTKNIIVFGEIGTGIANINTGFTIFF